MKTEVKAFEGDEKRKREEQNYGWKK